MYTKNMQVNNKHLQAYNIFWLLTKVINVIFAQLHKLVGHFEYKNKKGGHLSICHW